MVRANLNKDPDDVSKMFDDVASRYDFLNDLLSLGRTKAWRKSVTAIISPKSGMKILDIAAGTGSSSRPLVDKGAEVILVSGPSHQILKNDSIQLIKVVSAQEMFDVCHANFENIDVAIAAAAVADYRPKNVASQKIKKQDTNLTIELEKTQDILATLGEKKKNQFLIGFALETENELENAKGKIKKKNLDLIVLNSLNDKGAGFGHATNKVTFIDKYFNEFQMDLKSKEAVAQDIVNIIIKHYEK